MTNDPEAAWPRRRKDDAAAPASGRPRVVVVDDHVLLAESIALTLSVGGVDARCLQHNAPELTSTIIGLKPDLLLLDLYLSDDSRPSLALLEACTRAGIKVLVVTATNDEVVHAQCMERGAIGVLEKSEPVEVLTATVHRALRSEQVMSARRRSHLALALQGYRASQPSRSTFDSLTAKERDVLQAMLHGHAAGRISRDLGISVFTVRSHIRSILLKLEVHSQLEAVSHVVQAGWMRRE